MTTPRQDEIDRLARELQFEAEEKKALAKAEEDQRAAVRVGAAAEERRSLRYAEILRC